MTLMVALHKCKSAHSDAYSRADGKPPFACISVEDGKGGRVDLYFDDVDSIVELMYAASEVSEELQRHIDIAMEEADKAGIRLNGRLMGPWPYSDYDKIQTDIEC